VNYINLCPHAIVILGDTGGVARTILPSGQAARCAEQSEYLPMGNPDDIPLILRAYGCVSGLPEEGHDPVTTLYIVSNMVRQALPARQDIASPGDTVRDQDGQIIGVKNLIVNPA
jgi:hypothetical protein